MGRKRDSRQIRRCRLSEEMCHFRECPVKRSRELLARLSSMENVDVADLLGEEETIMTTPWLLSHALGVITTPSTIALDGALAKVPVAVIRYRLDLIYYSPLSLLDNLKDWQRFLDRLTEKSGNSHLKLIWRAIFKSASCFRRPCDKKNTQSSS